MIPDLEGSRLFADARSRLGGESSLKAAWSCLEAQQAKLQDLMPVPELLANVAKQVATNSTAILQIQQLLWQPRF